MGFILALNQVISLLARYDPQGRLKNCGGHLANVIMGPLNAHRMLDPRQKLKHYQNMFTQKSFLN